MSNAFTIPDAGTVTVNLPGGGVKTIDVYDCWNSVDEIRTKNDDEGGTLRGFHQKVAEYLQTIGLPPLTHYQVDQFVKHLGEAVSQLGKADGTSPTRT